ncbi:MAG: hypothetical protein MZU79_06060 [Anaerotruncus sp.]|nr:hypothetical protein [Anaerotruncus sp.]
METIAHDTPDARRRGDRRAAEVRPGAGRIRVSLDELIALAQGFIEPQGRLRCRLRRGERGGDGRGRRSHVREPDPARGTSTEANKVFPYIITVGPDARARGRPPRAISSSSTTSRRWRTAPSNRRPPGSASDLEARYGVGPLSNMSPGSLEDWPITEQTKLFSIFGDTERLVGVRLTDSMLMVPRKSISGILFPSEEGFVARQLCDREHSSRPQSPFTGVGPRNQH